MPRIKEQAICIRLIDWSQTSQIVTLLGERSGKIGALAKGSKRWSPSHRERFSGGIELLTVGQAVGIVKATADLVNLTEWDLQRSFPHLRRDLEAHRLGLYAAELSGAMLPERDAHPQTFNAVITFLEAIADKTDRNAALLRFQWQILEDCGYRPELEQDAIDGTALNSESTYVFDPQGGGLTRTAAQVVDADRGPWRVRAETIDLLRAVGSDQKTEAESQTVVRANRLLCVYARSILDTQLRTMHYVLDPPAT